MRIIAIDGQAGSGKTSLSTALAERLNLPRLNTGAMYRAVTWAVLETSGDPADEAFATQIAKSAVIELDGDHVTVDGTDVSTPIRGEAVTKAVSAVAAHAPVRAEMVAKQRQWVTDHGGGVVEGRDIGTVVFPDAELKIYLTVDLEESAQRRVVQGDYAKDDAPNAVTSIAEDLARRNLIDSTRAANPLRPADDAVIIDTTSTTVDEIVDNVISRLDS